MLAQMRRRPSDFPSRDPPVVARKAAPPSELSSSLALDGPIYRCASGCGSPGLALSQPHDPEEREADRTADRIMRSADESCGCGGTCGQCAGESVSGATIKRRARHASASVSSLGNTSIQRALSSAGSPLEAADRGFMERRFGTDLSDVRVHSGPAAFAAAESVDAHAFTLGHNVVFGAGQYAPGTTAGRRLLAHELAHVVQSPADQPVVRRYAACRRLLGDGRAPARAGPRVPESSVQEFLADEIEPLGDVERELPIPGGTAAPWRTEGRLRDPSIIDPQILGLGTTGQVDIALMPTAETALEFLEVKVATWSSAEFAEQQVFNYVSKGIESMRDLERTWARRRGYPMTFISAVREMPMSRYAVPQGPVQIDGQQVMLSWCRDGVIVFKALDIDSEEVHYCGISDRGRTDAFIGRILGQAEEAVARALARRLYETVGGPVNVRLLLDRVRERLQASIRYYLEESLKAICVAALEITLAAVLRDFIRRWLTRPDVLDVLLAKMRPGGESIPLPIGEMAAKTATVLTLGYILLELAPLVFAF
jgi:hypothetical protein